LRRQRIAAGHLAVLARRRRQQARQEEDRAQVVHGQASRVSVPTQIIPAGSLQRFKKWSDHFADAGAGRAGGGRASGDFRTGRPARGRTPGASRRTLSRSPVPRGVPAFFAVTGEAGGDRKGMRAIASALALLAAAAAASTQEQDDMRPGLVVEFFNIGKAMEGFPTIPPERKPDLRRVDRQINYEQTADTFPGTDMADHFYARWTGRIKIPRDGKYTFFTESDDGSRLWIDGKVVVDNGGLHAMEEKSGEV